MRRLALTALFLVAASSGMSATWHVAKDGSGDFAVIQDAVDAASAGDTIWIHAGRYEEMTEDWDVWGNGVSIDCHVVITKDNLTLQGDGRDATIIGPAVFPSNPDLGLTGINVTYNEANTLVVRDLAVENVRYGMYLRSPTCEVTGCRLENVQCHGLHVYTSTSCLVSDCDFVGGGTGVMSFDPTGNLTISNSRFDTVGEVCMCISTDSVVIENCIATDVPNGISIQQGSSGVIRNVDVSISSSSGVGLALEMGGSAEVYDSRFEGGWCGVYSNGEVIYCVRTVFTGNDTWTLRINNSGNSVFHDCEILNGGGLTVMCNYNGSGDCHIDMTNNDWGTDSAEQIAAWIHDSNDDPEYCCTVDFVPFKGMVPTAARSWSAVKGLFSGGDEE